MSTGNQPLLHRNVVAPQDQQEAQVNDERPTYEQLMMQVSTEQERYRNLQSYHDKTRTGLEKQVSDLRTQSSTFVPPKTEEEMNLFRQEHADLYGTIETMLHQKQEASLSGIKQDLQAAKAREAIAQIRLAHPDCYEIFNSEHFQVWATEQGPEMQAWVNEEHDASKVIRALTYYKAMASRQLSNGMTQSKQYEMNNSSSAAAESVNTRSSVSHNHTTLDNQPRAFTRAQISKMHINEYEANREAIAQSAAAGMIR